MYHNVPANDTFVPPPPPIDEQIGSLLGMELFVQHEVFKKFNVGFALDESIPSETEEYTIFTGESSAWCKPS